MLELLQFLCDHCVGPSLHGRPPPPWGGTGLTLGGGLQGGRGVTISSIHLLFFLHFGPLAYTNGATVARSQYKTRVRIRAPISMGPSGSFGRNSVPLTVARPHLPQTPPPTPSPSPIVAPVRPPVPTHTPTHGQLGPLLSDPTAHPISTGLSHNQNPKQIKTGNMKHK